MARMRQRASHLQWQMTWENARLRDVNGLPESLAVFVVGGEVSFVIKEALVSDLTGTS